MEACLEQNFNLEVINGVQLSLGLVFTKNRKKKLLEAYPQLKEIPDEEWDNVFYNNGKPWDDEDLQYLMQWYGFDSVLSLAYALGRTPTTLISTMSNIRAHERVVTAQ